MNIGILGSGSWGTALSVVLADNNHKVVIWSHREEYAREINTLHENPSFLKGVKLPTSIAATTDLRALEEKVDMMVMAVPSQFLRSVVLKLRSTSLRNIILVNVAKGIEVGTLMTMSSMLRDALPHVPAESIVTLSGPSHAEEVSRRIATTVVAASTSRETSRLVQAAFMTPYFRVYESTDIIGVELGGALKNVIAIAAGIIDGAQLGDNTKAALMTRGIVEIMRLGVAMGAQSQTFWGLSGIGDLMVTCMSRHSRNRFVGVEIGKGRSLDDITASMVMVAEGVETTKSANDLARKKGIEVPIMLEVDKMLFHKKPPRQACHDLMTRDPKGEH